MSKEKEFEKRTLINEENYLLLLEQFKSSKDKCRHIVQTNYYFDTKERTVLSFGGVLRLRIVHQGKKELTIKIKGKFGDTEVNQRLSDEEAVNILKNGVFPDGEIKDALLTYKRDLKTYTLLTSLTTDRYEFKHDDYLVVIDKNSYSDIIDYDLEIEAKDIFEAEKHMIEICNINHIEYKKDGPSKSKRAILAIQK